MLPAGAKLPSRLHSIHKVKVSVNKVHPAFVRPIPSITFVPAGGNPSFVHTNPAK